MKTRVSILTITGIAMSFVFSGAGAATVKLIADAAQRGHIEVVRELLREGADVNESQGDGMTALHWAAERDDLELAATLIYAGANVGAGTRIGDYTPLHVASRNGHAGTIKVLLAANADANARTSNSGAMPLHLAARSANPEAVSLLLDTGTDVNSRERAWGQTPLMFAAAANRAENVRILLEAGADPSITSDAVDVVEMERADKVAEERLVEVLADFKEKEAGSAKWLPQSSQVQAAIDFSREIQRRWPDVPNTSCDNLDPASSDKIEVDSMDGDCAELADPDTARDDPEPKPATYGELVGRWGGLTPLLHAVRQGHADAAMALLRGGADIDQRSAGDHTTPLLMASVNGQFDLALVLIEMGADPNLTSDAGTSPLFAVLERNWAPWANFAHPVEHKQQRATHMDVLSALLDAGADPNIRLNKHLWFSEFLISVMLAADLQYAGATPFWRAAHALDVDAMRALKAHGADPMIPTVKIAKRKPRRPMPKPEPAENEAGETVAAAETTTESQEQTEEDHSGLPPLPIGGPFVYPIHAASGAGYGQFFAANAHRHVPGNWLPAVRFLVEECGVDVNLRDGNGYTAVHHAASRGDNEMIKYLVEHGADVTFVSRKGQTTADMANGPIQRVPPFPDTIALLVSLGAVNNNNCVSC